MDLSNLPEIEFVKMTFEEVINKNIQEYEKAYLDQGNEVKKLYPGDPMRIYIYSKSLREYQLLMLINDLAKQNLLRYSTGDTLLHIGALFNTDKLGKKTAEVTIEITLSKVFEIDYLIPIGTRFSPGNQIYFMTEVDYLVSAGELSISVQAKCTEAGSVGNDFVPGQVNILVDVLPFVESVSNTITSFGGAEEEDEDNYKERIRLAPSSFSTAGPDEAYRSLAKSYSANVEDVYVYSPSPGVVNVVVAMESGIPSSEELDAIQAVVSGKYKRPLTDNVNTIGPTPKSYDIDFEYYISTKDALIESQITDKVNTAVEEYKVWQRSAIGKHINPSKLYDLVMKAGASRLVMTAPTYLQLQAVELAISGTVNVVYGGLENEEYL